MVTKDSREIEKLKKKARDHTVKEGIFASVKTSFGSYYLSPFAVAINVSSSLVALLTSISGLLGPISQIFGSKLITKYSRKKIILRSVLLESLVWLPLILICFLFYKNIITQMLPLLLLLLFSLYTIFFNVNHPAWFSWMGDIVDENKRGRWFSKRHLIMGFFSVILTISAAFLLDYFKKQDLVMVGFGLLFSLAFLGRITCWKIFRYVYEPKIKLKKADCISFWEFLFNAPKNNLGRFTIFRSFFAFATYITTPLVVIYLLRNLDFSYATYMIIIFSGTVFSLLFIELWGKLADNYGNYTVLCITSITLPIVPILWILNSSPIYLILPSAVSGIAWAGFLLASTNFIYDNTEAQKRGFIISYFNMISGVGIFLGAGLGAILIKYVNTSLVEPIIAIFIIGALARMLVVYFGLSQINEVRKTRKIHSPREFTDMVLKEAKPTIIEEVHEIMSIKKYFKE